MEATIKRWMDTYLRHMERTEGYRLRSLPSVRSYRAADTMEERFPEQQIPAVQIMLTTENKIVTGGDNAHMVFGGTVDVLVQSTEPEPTRRLAAVYAFAMGLMLQQQGLQPDPKSGTVIPVEGFGWADQGVPALGKPGGRWLALGSIGVAYAVQKVFDPLAGPTEPSDEPPNWPVAEHTKLVLEPEP